jgi:ribosome-binding factor A
MPSVRQSRINEEFRREIEDILTNSVKDPGLSAMVSIVRVEVTRDLSNAKAYVSLMGSEKERADSLSAIRRAGGFIRKELASRITLRRVPSLVFVSDDSIAYAIDMAQKIAQVVKEDESK